MPTTLQYRPILIDHLISNERISSYQQVFQPANDVELMGAYLWNSHVSAAFYPVIAAVEISLRNAIDRALKAHLGSFWWSGIKLRYRSFLPGEPAPYPVRAIREKFVKATRKFLTDQRRRHGCGGQAALVHHGVMAKTDFSTWGFLLDHEFMGNGLIWPHLMGTVFRGGWPSSQATATLSHASGLVSNIRDFRNRLFHHEPAWKRFGVSSESDALTHLQEKIGKIESLMGLIHPECLRLLEKNGLLANARRACTAHEIQRFQHAATTHKVNSLEKLHRLVRLGGRGNRVLSVRLTRALHGKFLITPG